MRAKIKSAAMMAGMVICWSLYYTFSKVLVDRTGSPFVTGLLLRAAALLFLTAQLWITGTLKTLLNHPRAAVMTLISIGVFGFLLDLFANLGYAKGSLGTGTALLKTDVLMVNLVTVLLERKRLTVMDWGGTVVMLFGVLLVLGVDFKGFTVNPWDLLFLLSAACVTANAFIIKRAQTKYGLTPDTVSYWNNGVVLLLFAGASFLSGDAGQVFGGALPKGTLWLALCGGLAQTGIYFFYYRNLKTHEVWLVKLYLLFMPVVSCFIGAVFLNERLTATKLMGILVVLIGAGVILLFHGRAPREREGVSPRP